MTDVMKLSIILIMMAIVAVIFIEPLNERLAGLFPSETYREGKTENADKFITRTETKQTRERSKKTASARKDTAAPDQKIPYDVKKTQRLLRKAGFYKGRIDGKTGPQTTKAIKEFQRSKKIKESGVMNLKTWKELKKYEE